jgi:hypothetical protein
LGVKIVLIRGELLKGIGATKAHRLIVGQLQSLWS